MPQHPIADKKAKIYLVENNTLRTQITELFKKHGYTDILGSTNLKDIMKAMEVEVPDWIVTPVLPEDDVNGFHILRLCTQIPALKNVRVSFLADENDEKYLLPGFELGLWSFIKKPFNREEFDQCLKRFIQTGDSLNWNDSLIAAESLRPLLEKNQRYHPWLNFERKLMRNYPTYTKAMVHMAEPVYFLGDAKKSKRILEQVKLIDKNLEPLAKEIFHKLQSQPQEGNQPLENNDDDILSYLDIQSAWIVDGDKDTKKIVNQVLIDLGVSSIESFDDGDAPAKLSAESRPELIVMNWRLAGLAGPLLIQRIRENGINAPIIVISENLNDQDGTILKELGVASIINKPIVHDAVMKTIIFTVQEDKRPAQFNSLEYKFRAALEQNQTAEAEQLAQKIVALPELGEDIIKGVNASVAFLKGNFEEARALCIDSLKLGGDNLFNLNLLGKISLKLHDAKSAASCFEKAQALSPLNLSRLCKLAEVNLELGNIESAQELTHAAEEIDKDSKVVQDTSTMVALSSGDSDTAKSIMEKLKSLSNILSFLNNKAVSMAQSGRIDESFGMYETALKSIPENNIEALSIVSYNYALACVRNHDYIKARDLLIKAKDSISEKMKKKLENLSGAVERAIANNKKIQIGVPGKTADGGDDDENSSGQDASDTNVVELKPGEMRCYLLYIDEENIKLPDYKKLLTKIPHFSFRGTIKMTGFDSQSA